MYALEPSLHNVAPHISQLAESVRRFRVAQPQLSVGHLDLLLLVSQEPGRDSVHYATLLKQPAIEVGLCVSDLQRSGADLLRSEVGPGGRLAEIRLSEKGVDLLQAMVSA